MDKSTVVDSTDEQSSPPSAEPLMIPNEAHSANEELTNPYDHCLKLDELGPVIINTDGSLQRVSNWHELTPEEQQRTFRLITARNKKRIEALQLLDDKANDVESAYSEEHQVEN